MPPSADEAPIPAHLYVCQHASGEVILPGDALAGWNEGLAEGLEVRRDLGRIRHLWDMLGPDGRSRRTDVVIENETLVTIGRTGAGDVEIAEGIEPRTRYPERLFDLRTLRVACRASAAEGRALAGRADVVEALVGELNRDLEGTLRARYEAWLAAQSPYPRGIDHRYRVPLGRRWKAAVIRDRTDLTEAQADELAGFGYPGAMEVRIELAPREDG